MKKISYLLLSLAMLVIAGMTAASCSNDDNTSESQAPALAKALVGEWIFEQTSDVIEVTGSDPVTDALSGATLAIIYRFFDDGTCWKEINLMKDGKLVAQTVSRYATYESTYTVDASGKVAVTLKNEDADGEESEVLTFDGKQLSTTYPGSDVTCILVPATDAQSRLYKAESDAWHGGIFV